MKNAKLLNSNLSAVVSQMGHKQTLTIGDAGLPIPSQTPRIDLAVTQNIPHFLEVLDAVLSELCVEKVIMAEEIKTVNPTIHEQILQRFTHVEIAYVSHEELKRQTERSMAIVRTGEITAYSNVILVSGVTF